MTRDAWRELVDASVEPERAARLVRERPELLEARGPLDETPLHFLCVEGFVGGVRTLISLGADVSPRNRLGDTPLHDVAVLGEVEVARLLLDAGADPLLLSTDDETPLHVACDHGQRGVVELLTGRGLRLDALHGGWTTPAELLAQATARGE